MMRVSTLLVLHKAMEVCGMCLLFTDTSIAAAASSYKYGQLAGARGVRCSEQKTQKDRKWKELKKQIEMLNDVLMDARRFHHHL